MIVPLQRNCFVVVIMPKSTEAGSIAGGAIVEVDDESVAPAPAYDPWPNEPASLDQLQDQYNLEMKCSGRVAGTSLYLVHASKRDGQRVDVQGDQEYKLYLVT